MISVLRSLAFVRRGVTAATSICAAVISPIAFAAAQCPFDNGASDAVNDGVVLTRYALGITGAPLVASTKYASLDPLQVKNNIECVGCALDMNGDGAIDTVDTTIIARHLSGFTGASLTAGLALGVGSRNSTAAVTSFLASGCALGGAINAWTLGGNAFGVAGVIGSTDAFPVTLQSGGASANVLIPGGNGLRIFGSSIASAPNVVNGSSANAVAGSPGGATVAGGLNNTASGSFAVVVGGFQNTVSGNYATVGGGSTNTGSADNAVVAGGLSNTASAFASSVSGGAYGKARLYGQTANAAGGFSGVAGTAQATQYVLRNRTTDATTTFLFLDGAGQSLVFEPGRAGLMDVQVVAFAEGTGFSASYAFRCHYAAVVGGGTIQPFPCPKTVVYEAEASWDANVAFAPSATSGFGIAVNGAIGRNIRWVATVRATEVSLQ